MSMSSQSLLLKCALLLYCSTVGYIQAQQDAQYNMYLFNQYIINPAYGGTRNATSMVASIRNQWVSFPGAPQTAYISVHGPIQKYKLGYGISAMNDKIGAHHASAAYGSISYILPLSKKWKLSFGARAGAVNYQFNLDKTTYKDPNDNTFGLFNNYQKLILDIDGGIYVYTRSFYMGLSATHLNQTRIIDKSFSSANTQYSLVYSLHTHTFFTIGKSFFINENFLLNINYMQQGTGKIQKGDISINTLLKNKLWLGVFLRGGYGLGFLTQIIISKQWKIGYSYDIGGGIRRSLGGTHEIMIGWDIRSKNNTSVVNPRFL